jgi:hypothetical protein
VFEEGSSDTFILNGVTYTDWGDEINVKEGTYGIYKEVGKEPNESTKCYVLVNF